MRDLTVSVLDQILKGDSAEYKVLRILRKGSYWQITIAESYRRFTDSTIHGSGGYTNLNVVLIDQVPGPELEPYVFGYPNDIIILAPPTYEKHLEVLSRLRSAGLTLNREKCQFCHDEVNFLGYVVNKQDLLVDPDNIKEILQIHTPTTVSEVRRLVGVCS